MAASPSLAEFVAAAKPLNPDVSDEQIVSYWQEKYAPKAAAPSLDEFAKAARPLNHNTTDEEIKAYWEKTYKADYEKSRERGWGQFTGDMAIKAAQGAVGLGEAAVGLGDIVSGGIIGKALAGAGYDPKRTKEAFGELSSDKQKRLEQEVGAAGKDMDLFDGFVAQLGAIAKNPSFIPGAVVESLPSMLAAGGGAKALAERIYAKAVAGGATAAEAALAVEKSASALKWAAASGEGAISAGQIAEEARQAGRDWAQYVLPALAGGTFTAGIGRAAGAIPGLGDAETALFTRGVGAATGNRAVRTIKGAFQEGLLEEMPQSAQEQAMGNLAQGKDAGEGVGAAAAQGLVTGAAMGAGAGLISRARVEQPAPSTPSVEPTPPAPAAAPSLAEQAAQADQHIASVLDAKTPDEAIAAAVAAPAAIDLTASTRAEIDHALAGRAMLEQIEKNAEELRLQSVADLTRQIEEHDAKGLNGIIANAFRESLVKKLTAMGAEEPAAPKPVEVEAAGWAPQSIDTSTFDNTRTEAAPAPEPAEVRIFGKTLAELGDAQLQVASKAHRMSGFRAAAKAELERRAQERAALQPPQSEATAAPAQPEAQVPVAQLEQSATKNEFASTQVPLSEADSAQVMGAAKSIIAPEDVHQEKGLEDRPHITVKYGLHTADVEAVRKLVSAEPPVRAKVTGIEIFQPKDKDYDVVVARVDSADLVRLNAKIAESLPNTETYPEYKPHITLGYVKRGMGEKYAEAKTGIEGKELTLDTLEVSDQDEHITPIKLMGKTAATPNLPAVPQRLYVERNGQRFEVASLEEASQKWGQFFTAAASQGAGGAGGSIGGAKVVDQDGKEVARISQNGRVWPPGEWKPGMKPLITPASEKRTPEQIAEHEAWVKQVKAEAEAKAPAPPALTAPLSRKEAAIAAEKQARIAYREAVKSDAPKEEQARLKAALDRAEQELYGERGLPGLKLQAKAGKTPEAKAAAQAEIERRNAAAKQTAAQERAAKQAARTAQSDLFNHLKDHPNILAAANKTLQEFEAVAIDQAGEWLAAENVHAGDDAVRKAALAALTKVDPKLWEALHKEAQKAARKAALTPKTPGATPGKKLENTGVDLRRHWESVKAELKAKNDVEGITGMNKVFVATTRADLFSGLLGENATAGANHLVDMLRDAVKPFKEWSRAGPLARLYGRTYGMTQNQVFESFIRGTAYLGDSAARDVYEGIIPAEKLHAQGFSSENDTTVEDRLRALAKVADQYIQMVRGLTIGLRGKTSASEVADDIRSTIWKKGLEAKDFSYYGALMDSKLTEQGQMLNNAGMFERNIRLLAPFNDAISNIIKNENEIKAKTRKDSLVPPRLENIVRTGLPEKRGTRDVTPKEFKETFGFADIGFGTWVNSKEDQAHLNHAYDAFHDLAEFAGIDPTWIGFKGKLHFTLGALGHGSKAAATFHPAHPGPNGTVVQVINLTKTKGDGTVSHEWFHALDHFLRTTAGGTAAMRELVAHLKSKYDFQKVYDGAMRGLKGQAWMTSQKSASPVEKARGLARYYARGIKTDYKANADKLGADYWGNDAELAARAWEAHVYDNLGGTHNYLVNGWVGDGITVPPKYRGTPYPRGDERKAFSEWYKALTASLNIEGDTITVDLAKWNDAKPKSKAEFEASVENLIETMPVIYAQMQAEEQAKKNQAIAERNEEIRAEAAAAKAALEAAQRDKDAENPPTPETPAGVLRVDDLEKLFDEAADDLKAQDREDAQAPEPGERALHEETPSQAEIAADLAGTTPKAAAIEDKKAGALISEAAKLGVKGVDEALKGLTKLFGGGRIQSFPGGFDEATYNEAKPHFEAALQAFQDAGKTLKDLFKLLIQQFGEGVKPYAIRFAQEKKLTAALGAQPSASMKIAQWVRGELSRPTAAAAISSPALFKKADEAFGGLQSEGKYTPKDAYDAAEAGFNLWLQYHPDFARSGSVEHAKATIAYLKKITDLLPTQTKRTQEMDEFQQFSTVPALAFMVNWVANVKPGETMLEPSAGIGGIAVFAKMAGANVVVNELSSRRAAVLREVLPEARVFTENAEQLHNILPDDVQPTVIEMNPPFSATAGRSEGKRDTKNGAAHIEQAMLRLAPGGRLVAIVGEGMSFDRPAFKGWWKEMQAKYTVRAVVTVSGAEYAKYGTTFDNAILVIDKTGPTTEPVVTGRAEAYNELPEMLSNVRDQRHEPTADSRTPESATQQPGGGEPAAPVLPRPGNAERPGAGTVGAGTGNRPGGGGATPGTGGAGGVNAPATRPGKGVGDRSGNGVGGLGAGTGSEGAGLGERPSGVGVDSGAVAGELTLDAAGVENRDRALTDSVFEPYEPRKAKVAGAKPHPGMLVESAAMSAVEPIDATYTPNLPRATITEGKVSSAQIEAVIYAGQAHQEQLPDGTRRGFLIGDGTGVGKGREIAAIILDNQRQGRKKHLWISAKAGLFKDAKRDFTGAGANPDDLFELSGTKPGEAVKQKSGVMFTTYDTLRGAAQITAEQRAAGVKAATRLDQIVKWLGEDFDGVLVFDEAHNMGNVGGKKGARGVTQGSQKAFAGVELQRKLPQARIVYVSATAATEVDNLMYATRLGLWGETTAFPNAKQFSAEIGAAGIASMELVARDMKAQGSYIARSLSYDGVEQERIDIPLTPLQTDIYDELARAWQIVLQNINSALKETGQEKDGQAKGRALSRFWGTHQRFFNQVITSMQTPEIMARAQEEIAKGNAVVFQLVNTNEATQERLVERAEANDTPLEELDFTPRETLIEYVRNAYPIEQYEEYTDEEGKTRSRPVNDSSGNPVINRDAVKARDDLIKTLSDIRVPDNPLDLIVEALGSDTVAEVTGRGRRFVKVLDKDSGFKLVEQKRGKNSNAADAQAFMDDRKRALIFSDAGGTGYSFQSDLGVKNLRRRIHFLVQPGWRADNAVQGFGRTHRSNEANQPVYVLATTNLKAQRRFISSIARRLDQLGALTKGQRNTSSQGLFTNRDNLESKYATAAVRALIEDMFNARTGLTGNEVLDNAQQVFSAMGLDNLSDKDGKLNQSAVPEVPRFLNRLLSLTVEWQNKVFAEFEARMDAAIDAAIERGTYDDGMQTLRALKITKERDEVVYTDQRTKATTRYVELKITNPTTLNDWNAVQAMQDAYPGKEIQYFLDNHSGLPFAVIDMGSRVGADGAMQHRGYRFNVKAPSQAVRGLYITNLDTILKGGRTLVKEQEDGTEKRVKNYDKLEPDVAETLWQLAYEKAPTTEDSKLHILTGTLLPVWDRIKTDESVAVVRTQTDDGERLIGRVLADKTRDRILKNLGVGALKSDISAAELVARIMKGETAHLSNGWTITKSRVANENRLELQASYFSHDAEKLLKTQGAFIERIGWKERVFIPINDDYKAFERITRGSNRPVIEFSGKEGGDNSPFSRSGGPGMLRRDVQAVANLYREKFKGAPQVHVLDAVKEAPEELRKQIRAAGAENDVAGAWHEGEVYLFANHLKNPEHAAWVLTHELTHHGLRGMFGRALDPVLIDIYLGNKTIREAAKLRAAKEGLSKAQAVEEVLADMGADGIPQSVMDKLVAFVRRALRSLGMKLEITDADVRGLVASALESVKNPAKRTQVLSGSALAQNESGDQTDAVIRWPELTNLFQRFNEPVDGKFLTEREVLDEVEFLISDGRAPETLTEPAAAYREALREDFEEYAGRGDVEPAQEAFMAAVEAAVEPQITIDKTAQNIMFSRAGALGAWTKAANITGLTTSLLKSPRTLGIFNAFNSQYHKAAVLAKKGFPQFKAVFDKLQDYINDTNAIAVTAEQQAPAIFSELKGIGLKDIKAHFKGAAKESDIQAIAPWLNRGTLYGGGNPLEGVLWTDDELRGKPVAGKGGVPHILPRGVAPLNDTQIALYHEARNAIATSIQEGAKAVIFRHAIRHGINFDKTDSLDQVVATVKDQLEGKREELKIREQHATDVAEEAFAEAEEAKAKAKADGSRESSLRASDAKARYRDAQKALDEIKADIETLETLIGTKDKIGTIDAIDKQANGLIDHGYMPLKRFGNRTVTARDRDGNVMFFAAYDGTPLVPKSADVEMNKVAEALREMHPDWKVTTGVKDEESWKLYQGLSLDALENFLDFLDPETKAEIEKDKVVQEYLKNAVNTRSVMKELIHRKGTPGFSNDVPRVLASFITSHARNASGLYNLGEAKRLANEIPNEQGDVKGEAVKLIEYVTKPGEEAAKLRGFLFFHFLGGSVAAAAVNLTQTPMMTAPVLTQYASLKKVTASLLAAAKQAVMDPKTLPGEAGKALQKAELDGITAPQQIHHLTATAANNPFSSNRQFRTFMTLWGGLFGTAEVFNRRVAFLAAYDIAQDNGLKGAEAYDFAKKVVVETQLIYNKANKANLGRGALGSTVMTFKAFSIGYLELFSRLPRKQQLIMLGMLLLVAGAEGAPFAEDIEDLVDTLGQWLGFSTNTGKWTGKVVRETLGKDFERPILKGLGGLLPLDLHSRLGMGNLVPGTAFLKQSEIDKARDVAEAVGPIGSVLKGLTDSLQLLARGKWDKAAVGVAPKTIRDAYNGARMIATGESEDTKGRLALKDVTGVEGFGKMIGFNPQRASIESETKRELQLDKNLRTVRMDEIASDWADGILRKDPEATQAARDKLRQWNTDNPSMRIVPQVMLRSVLMRVREARMTSEQRYIKSLPKSARAEAREEFRP